MKCFFILHVKSKILQFASGYYILFFYITKRLISIKNRVKKFTAESLTKINM